MINRQWRVASTIFDLMYVSSPFFFWKHLNYANCGQNISSSKWNPIEHLLCFSLEEILESAKTLNTFFILLDPCILHIFHNLVRITSTWKNSWNSCEVCFTFTMPFNWKVYSALHATYIRSLHFADISTWLDLSGIF